MGDSLFYDSYDLLFRDKDYAGEIEQALAVAAPQRTVRDRVLEIGCGTGGHTRELAKRVEALTAIDVDPEMVARCRAKLADCAHVEVLHSRVEDLPRSGYSLALALFHVVTYIETFAALLSFLRGAHAALADSGVLLFDCWNGVAALRDPPQGKHSVARAGEVEVDCRLESATDFLRQRTVLTYDLRVTRAGAAPRQVRHSFAQTLWTPNQLEDALAMSGFTVARCYPSQHPEREVRDDTWKITFLCRR